MRCASLFVLAFALVASSTEGRAQGNQKSDQKPFPKMKQDVRFPTQKPAVGDPVPDVTVYSTDGKPVQTAELRGQYTVLVFGCLT